MTVSHANNKALRRQLPNLQFKRIWVPEMGHFVRLRVSTRALRSISKMGFVSFARKQGIDIDGLIAAEKMLAEHAKHDHA